MEIDSSSDDQTRNERDPRRVMRRNALRERAAFNRLIGLLTATLTFVALYFGREILLPVALAILLSFLLAPLVSRLERWKLKRVPAVMLVVMLSFAVMGGIGYMVTEQLIQLGSKLPDYRGNLIHRVRSVSSTVGGRWDRILSTFRDVGAEFSRDPSDATIPVDPSAKSDPEAKTPDKNGEGGGNDKTHDGSSASDEPNSNTESPLDIALPAIGGATSDAAAADVAGAKRNAKAPVPVRLVDPPSTALEQVSDWIGSLMGVLGTTSITLVLVIFILIQREDLRNRIIHLVGSNHIRLTTEILNESAGRLSRYLRMQLSINAFYGLAAGFALYFIGVPNSLLWGVLAALLRFLPYVGPWLAAAMPLTLALTVFNGWTEPLLTVVVFIILELLVNLVLEPLLYGTSAGVSSLGVILSAILWTWLWGPVGLVLAMPLTVCLVAAGRHVPQLRFVAILFGDRADLPLEDRVYQRLLALDEDEVTAIVHDFRKEGSLLELYDDVLLPTLQLAEIDHHAGLLSTDQENFLVPAMREIVEDVGNDLAAKEQLSEESVTAAKESSRILCVAVRDDADETAAMMLAQLLREQGHDADIATTRVLTSESVARVAAEHCRAVFLSVVPPLGGRDGRYHCKQLRRDNPNLPIIVGLWGISRADSAKDRLLAAGATLVVNSLEDAIKAAQQYAAVPARPLAQAAG